MSTKKHFHAFGTLSAILIVVSVLLTACGGSSSVIGKWQHIPNPTPTPPPTPTSTGSLLGDLLGGGSTGYSTSCDLFYPNSVEFFKDGTYAGQLGYMWGGGNYNVVENGRITLDTMGGGMAAYNFSVSGNMLIFTDDAGCTFQYQRVP
jgi:hypothetical protein